MELKMLTVLYERGGIHEQWQSVYRRNPLQEKLNKSIMDRLLANLNPQPNALIFDAGCGSGLHTLELARRGFQCVAVDVSEYILNEARRKIQEAGLSQQVNFVCEALDELSFDAAVFDIVYCRGVLMHIPALREAVAHLCRVLKPGGSLMILESNHRSIEMRLVLALRRFKRVISKIIHTPAGIEFWAKVDGEPFLVRATNIEWLSRELSSHGVDTQSKSAAEFWDINRFPAGPIRNMAIRFNRLCFKLHVPWLLSNTIAIMGKKKDSAHCS